MTRTPVSSSHLAAIGYDPVQQTLEIEFQNGSVYRYYSVARQSYDELMAAASPGAYFNTRIKRRHAYRRINVGNPNLARLSMPF
ncbi:MAG: KTSC domain-containing protein [Chloroflexi bacterium]|nr:MAG: KTSC domain-containing protein [Chloroflexota bacterium]